MLPGGVGYSDTPSFGGFSPKSPCSDHAMELGDMEAAFVGNLARYCMVIGTIPPHSLKGFWWVNGECKGLGVVDWESDVEPIQPLINHLAYWAPYIIGTEGVDELLRAGEETRWYSKKMFPHETGEWVSEKEAINVTGRTVQTLREWRRSGGVRFLKDRAGIEYYKHDLELMMEIKRGNMNRAMRGWG